MLSAMRLCCSFGLFLCSLRPGLEFRYSVTRTSRGWTLLRGCWSNRVSACEVRVEAVGLCLQANVRSQVARLQQLDMTYTCCCRRYGLHDGASWVFVGDVHELRKACLDEAQLHHGNGPELFLCCLRVAVWQRRALCWERLVTSSASTGRDMMVI